MTIFGAGLRSGVDPDLPVDLFLGEGEVVAGNSGARWMPRYSPYTTPPSASCRVRIQEVRQRHHDAVFVRQLVQHRVDGAGISTVRYVLSSLSRAVIVFAVVPGRAVERVAGGIGDEARGPLDGRAAARS
jgi:hypothetical protein